MHNTDIRGAQPVMIRVYNEDHKGATAFFRNRPFLDAFFTVLRQRCKDRIRILVHAASVGAEPYSLALWWLNRILPHWKYHVDFAIVATDIDAAFLDFAKQARYPQDVLLGMTEEERGWFEKVDGAIVVPERAKHMVRFLEPRSFLDDAPEEMFDAVLVMNAMTYVSTEEQTLAIRNCTGRARHVFCATAFHPDSIMRDMIQSGFSPCAYNHRAIHESWGDRLAHGPVPKDSPEYSWRLPPYDETLEDWLYRFGAIFLRNSLSQVSD